MSHRNKSIIEKKKRLGMTTATMMKTTRRRPTRTTEIEKLCDEHLQQSMRFVRKLVALSSPGIQKAGKIENVMVGQFSELVGRARLFALSPDLMADPK